MPDAAPARPAAGEIREYLRTRFNQALRRPGLYGGETALQLLIDALAFADARQPEWNQAQASLRTRGATTSLGVRGAFQRLGGDHGARSDDPMASVYAEMTLPLGWVRLDRPLTGPEYGELCRHPRGRGPSPGPPPVGLPPAARDTEPCPPPRTAPPGIRLWMPPGPPVSRTG